MQGQINHQQQIQLQLVNGIVIIIQVYTDTTPTVPGTLTATNTVSSVSLNWGASNDASGVITYEVFRNDVFFMLKLVIYLILIILAI
jgi:hypothetical protein